MKKRNLSTILLVLALIVGLSLLLYPSVSNYWNSFHQSTAIANYAQKVTAIKKTDYQKYFDEAREYNGTLKNGNERFTMTEKQREVYNSLLDVTGDGVMGYIEIPVINVSLPIYHGTGEAELQVAVGHVEGSSLPVGGLGTHTVLSGHRGLPSARLFTDLDKMVVGDIFFIRVLNETYTYEVDQIRIVLPEEMQNLDLDPKKEYCTLVTCTPYGINTHRMLVRGKRIENPESVGSGVVTANAVQIEPRLCAVIIGAVLILVLILLMFVRGWKKQ